MPAAQKKTPVSSFWLPDPHNLGWMTVMPNFFVVDTACISKPFRGEFVKNGYSINPPSASFTVFVSGFERDKPLHRKIKAVATQALHSSVREWGFDEDELR